MNKHGLYSKAAQIIRGLPQERGTADQMVAAAKKLGIKDAELQNAGPLPEGKVTREQLAKHFEDKLPKMYVSQYGENPSFMPKGSGKRFMDLQMRGFKDDLSPDERRELNHMAQRNNPNIHVMGEDEEELHDPIYDNYKLPGGQNYRERLLSLGKRKDQDSYHSSHWTEHENVLAHLRLQDRNAGNKKLLHVEELQSDWGQEGRDKGFYDPKNPYEVFNKKTGDVLSSHPTHSSAWDAFRSIPDDQAQDLDYGRSQKVPSGPYVTNTQHWTDLALKNVLREAALGNYDGIVFSPGQAQADRYGLEKQLDVLHYDPSTQTLSGGKNGFWPLRVPNVAPEDLKSHVGAELAAKLMAPENSSVSYDGAQHQILKGDDLKVGGEGMKGYYDNIVPKSVMRLAQQHDPAAKPGDPVQIGQYQGFHLPMTDKMKSSILDDGFPAFKRGGRVGKAGGGELYGVNDNQIGGVDNAQAATGNSQNGTQAGGLPLAGGVRGGQGVLSSSPQASGDEDLIGLPKTVSMPKIGQTITASHDPRIRQVARDYASQAGIQYKPPTTYQKVDPQRAKRIAAAYDAMPHDPNHPLVRASYNALLNETKGQYEAMKRAGVHLEFQPDPNVDPYKSNPRLAVEDLRHNNHMYVYPTDAGYGSGDALPGADENPMLGDTGERWNGKPVLFNDLFRAVHDYFGHAKEGVGFRADGEENAWRHHAAMFSPLARIALGTETRGQNSWLNYGPHGDKNRTAATEDTVFAPQKLGVLPHWVHHEGAEDFIPQHERDQMEQIYRAYGMIPSIKPRAPGGAVDAALAATRRFTKDGKAAMVALKPKGN